MAQKNVGLKAILEPEFDKRETKDAVDDLKDAMEEAEELDLDADLSGVQDKLSSLGITRGGGLGGMISGGAGASGGGGGGGGLPGGGAIAQAVGGRLKKSGMVRGAASKAGSRLGLSAAASGGGSGGMMAALGGGAGGALATVALGGAIAVGLLKGVEKMASFSPRGKKMADMFGQAMDLFFRPMGDLVGRALMPYARGALKTMVKLNEHISSDGLIIGGLKWLKQTLTNLPGGFARAVSQSMMNNMKELFGDDIIKNLFGVSSDQIISSIDWPTVGAGILIGVIGWPILGPTAIIGAITWPVIEKSGILDSVTWPSLNPGDITSSVTWPSLSSDNITSSVVWPAIGAAGILGVVGWPVLGANAVLKELGWPHLTMQGMVDAITWPSISSGAILDSMVWPTIGADEILDIFPQVSASSLMSAILNGTSDDSGGSRGGGITLGGGTGEVELPGAASGAVVREPSVVAVGEGGENEAILPISRLEGMLSNERQAGAAEPASLQPVQNNSRSPEGASDMANKLDNVIAELKRLGGDTKVQIDGRTIVRQTRKSDTRYVNPREINR